MRVVHNLTNYNITAVMPDVDGRGLWTWFVKWWRKWAWQSTMNVAQFKTIARHRGRPARRFPLTAQSWHLNHL